MNFNILQIYSYTRVMLCTIHPVVIHSCSFVFWITSLKMLPPRTPSIIQNIHLKCFSITLRIGNCTKGLTWYVIRMGIHIYIYIGTRVRKIHYGINQGHMKRLIPERMHQPVTHLCCIVNVYAFYGGWLSGFITTRQRMLATNVISNWCLWHILYALLLYV